MSRRNKVNKTNYTQAGRLTPDDMARERMNQNQMTDQAKDKENAIGKPPSDEREPNRPRSAPEQ